jgi:hypothetical protein
MVDSKYKISVESELEVLKGSKALNSAIVNGYNLNAGLYMIKNRMSRREDCPLWLLGQLDDMIYRSNSLIRNLVEYRDEIVRNVVKEKK